MRLLPLLLGLVTFGCATPHALWKTRANPVGLSMHRWADPSRRAWTGDAPRPLVTAVWYPVAATTTQAPWQVAIFEAGLNAIDAPPLAGRFPLIILSHGTGGAAASIAWLAEALAANGNVVAVVNHHGNTAAEDALRLEAQLVWWDRPRDVRRVIDLLLADPTFGPHLDAARIGVAGFSLGGYTALASVGARLELARYRAWCGEHPQDVTCALPPEAAGHTEAELEHLLEAPRLKAELEHAGDDFADPRIKAAFVIAPVLAPAFAPESLARVAVPVELVVGAADDQSAPATNAEPLSRALAHAAVTVLPGVGHYTFLSVCTPKGRRFVPQLCADPPGVDRDAVHTDVALRAQRFFEQALRP
ncbi:MAG: alpha/beta hydrolase family protein [Myxococcota bacterium]